MFHITAEPLGPRDNLVFEGLTLPVDGRSLWVSMEGPLLEDGPVPTMIDGAGSGISRFDRGTYGGFARLAAQNAYRIDPIPARGARTFTHAQNGVSEFLAVDKTYLFVLERALVTGAGWRIRLFEADWSGVTDNKAIDALRDRDRSFARCRRSSCSISTRSASTSIISRESRSGRSSRTAIARSSSSRTTTSTRRRRPN
jgi:hypothetical protein